jgi:hypothetical protein
MTKPYEYQNPANDIRSKLRIGMSVTFGTRGGEQTDAIVMKINKKNVKVQAVQARGTAPAGGMWNVAPGLITIRDDANFSKALPSEKDLWVTRILGQMEKHGITIADLQGKK